MRLKELLSGYDFPSKMGEREIRRICTNTRENLAGGLFVCLTGTKDDGHRYAAEAAAQGAVVLCERDCNVSDAIRVPDTREAYARCCAAWFQNPGDELTLCAVTGTNGKTSTATTAYRLLRMCGIKSGLIGTTGAYWEDKEEALPLTTPDPMTLHRILRRMSDDGVTHVMMEASSHALDQKRLFGLHFSVAVFTNLTQDHFDYHKSMVEYFYAKKKLFEQADRAVVCIDDRWGMELAETLTIPVQTVSRTGARAAYSITDIESSAEGVRFTLSCFGLTRKAQFPVPGDFSAENAVCAAAVCALLGRSPEETLPLLQDTGLIPGRCEPIPNQLGLTILCDYAHTPDGIEKILSAARTFTKRKLIVVFGCGGDRDHAKRPLMGAAAAKYADFLVLTSDNPRTERAGAILSDILKGVPPGTRHIVLPERTAAIRYALDTAKPGDTVIFAGKGHETGQYVAGKCFAYNERASIRHLITILEEIRQSLPK